jgi:hypothetical protein
MNKIRILPSKFTCKLGYDVTLIERIGRIAWYEARYVNGTKLQGYFVAKIRVRKEAISPRGKVIQSYEQFPPESEGGRMGHFYMPKSRDVAEAHFDALVAEDDSMPSDEPKAA